MELRRILAIRLAGIPLGETKGIRVRMFCTSSLLGEGLLSATELSGFLPSHRYLHFPYILGKL